MPATERFIRLVEEVAAEQGIRPPRRVRVLANPKRGASATAVRFGRLGSGVIVSTQVMIDDLTDTELGVVVRHELAHYRHAEARWAPLQALACFSPLFVVVFGWPIAHIVGRFVTVALYFVSLIAHVLAFKSKRFFEARADRESVKTAEQARAAQRALLKFGTLKKRSEMGQTGTEAEDEIAAFSLKIQKRPSLSDRIFNEIWGIHPLLSERLALYAEFASSHD